MTAAEIAHTGALEVVSPELALVDPHLGASARQRLGEALDTLATLETRIRETCTAQTLSRSDDSLPEADDEIEAARRRITALSEVEPVKARRQLRAVTVVPALSAWSGFALFIAQYATSG